MKKIIVIDDDESNLDVICLILEHAGHNPHCYTSGTDLLVKVDRIGPDLIIIDMMLSGEDGRNLCRMLKTHPDFKKIPVLMISIGNKEHLIAECFADGYIEKPFELEVLTEVVNSYL
jgi:CheY-like chemotaxis protein